VASANRRLCETKTRPTILGVQGVQEFRSSGVQEFRSSGVQEFRSSGVQEFRMGAKGRLQAENEVR
jgi:hypothetical protein